MVGCFPGLSIITAWFLSLFSGLWSTDLPYHAKCPAESSFRGFFHFFENKIGGLKNFLTFALPLIGETHRSLKKLGSQKVAKIPVDSFYFLKG
jgi:hypothetical protein